MGAFEAPPGPRRSKKRKRRSTSATCPILTNIVLNPTQRRFNKVLSSARATVERAFGVLKERCRILLKRMDNRFINLPEVILTCCILHNFCQESGEEFDDHARRFWEESLPLGENILQSRRLHHAVRNPAAQAVRQAIENNLKWLGALSFVAHSRNSTFYCFVLLQKHMEAKTFNESEQFMK